MAVSTTSLSTAARRAALRACPLFASLERADLERIADFATLRKIGKGEYLFREGEPTSGFYIVRSGAINVHRVGADGREKTIHIFREGESFAEATLPGGGSYPADASAADAAVVVFIPREEFLQLLRERSDLALRMLASMSQHLRELVNALDDLTRKDVGTRLAGWLLRRCPAPLGAQPVEIRLDVSKTVLAAELRVRNETLSRALARMRGLGFIQTSGRTIRLLNPLALDAAMRENSERLEAADDGGIVRNNRAAG